MGERAPVHRRATSPASGSSAATTSTATPGASSASPATDDDRRRRPRGSTGRRRGSTRIVEQTSAVKSFFLKPPEWRHLHRRPACRRAPHRARRLSGAAQLFDRLGAGVAGRVELVIEKLDDGEVSPFFHDVVQAGDDIEMRGPIGGHFIWDTRRRRPDPARRRRLGRRAARLDAPPPRARRAARCRRCSSIRRGGSTR